MKILDIYLARAVLLGTLLTGIVLVSLDRVFALIRQLDDLGVGDFDFPKLLLTIVLQLPGSVYQLAPTAALLGALLGLGALASSSELIVLRTTGMSPLRIARPLLILGLALSSALFAIGEWVVPQSEERATRLRMKAMSRQVSLGGATGYWMRDGDYFINVERVLPGLNLQGIVVYHIESGRMKRRISAQSAHRDDAGNWQLDTATQVAVDTAAAGSGSYRMLPSPVQFKPELLQSLSVKPEMLSGRELYDNMNYLKANQLESSIYELAFWSKFATPLSTVVMFMLALPFVFGSQRQASTGKRIFVGSIIGIAYLLLSKVLGQVSVIGGLPGAVGAFIPPLAFLLLTAYAIRRQN